MDYKPLSKEQALRLKAVYLLARGAHDEWKNGQPLGVSAFTVGTSDLSVTLDLVHLGTSLSLVWDEYKEHLDQHLNGVNIPSSITQLSSLPALKHKPNPLRTAFGIIRNSLAHGRIHFASYNGQIESVEFINDNPFSSPHCLVLSNESEFKVNKRLKTSDKDFSHTLKLYRESESIRIEFKIAPKDQEKRKKLIKPDPVDLRLTCDQLRWFTETWLDLIYNVADSISHPDD